jgi:hypothetical protein
MVAAGLAATFLAAWEVRSKNCRSQSSFSLRR